MSAFDVIIIGAGPGGYVAAIRAAQLGMKTAIVEKENVGGVCLNWGCIPTKTLLRSADVYREIKEASDFGLKVDKVDFDLTAIVRRSRNVSKKLNAGVKYLLKKNDVTLYEGHGRLDGAGKVIFSKDGKDKETLTAKHIILATGARPRALPGIEPDDDLIWTSRNAMVPRKMPKSLLVVGSGAIGIEFAAFYRTFGVEVTIVEVLDRILPLEDAEVSEAMKTSLTKQGIKIETGAMVKSVTKGDDFVEAVIEKSGEETKAKFDNILLAVGVVANIEGVGLETTKVRVEKGHIVTNEWLETDEAGVYAIGDIVAPPWLAHKASHEGVICVEKIAGKEVPPLNPKQIPSCIYCHPQAASIGVTEAQAIASGKAIKVGRFPYSANGKAMAIKEPEGFIKTIFDAKTGELLGAHLFGAEVTEMVQGFAIAMQLETTEEELMHTVFPHPTLSEMMHESVLDSMGRAIHF